jgi:hypothetical protein
MDALQEFFGVEAFDFDSNKKSLITNLDYLKAMSVEEQTFYKKWLETQNYRDVASKLNTIKAKIWHPTDINDEVSTIKEIENCQPELVYVETKQQNEDWTLLRVFVSTFEFNQTPGRFLKFLIVDRNKPETPYIGVLAVSSDVITITDRDNYIGWNKNNKIKDKKLAHSAIGSSIISTQPFGYNFLGGKLAAAMVVSKGVQDKWKELYNQTLVGMTTTSLYGSYSMYNSLKWWHKCGTSAGKIAIKPDDTIYKVWHEWVKENYADKYEKAMTQKEGVSGPVTGAKSRVISMIFSKCGIKQSHYMHGYERGVYYSCFYENTKEYLQNKINDDQLKIKDLFKKDITGILEWWRPKAIERYKKLKSEGNLKPEIHYYNKMIGMSYDEAKDAYFKEVGR